MAVILQHANSRAAAHLRWIELSAVREQTHSRTSIVQLALRSDARGESDKGVRVSTRCGIYVPMQTATHTTSRYVVRYVSLF